MMHMYFVKDWDIMGQVIKIVYNNVSLLYYLKTLVHMEMPILGKHMDLQFGTQWDALDLKRFFQIVQSWCFLILTVLNRIQLEFYVKMVGSLFDISYINLVFILACVNGDVKLLGGKYSNEGTVLVCYNNLWGLISDDGWSNGDAEVVCNKLGHHGGSMSHYVMLTIFSVDGFSC